MFLETLGQYDKKLFSNVKFITGSFRLDNKELANGNI